MIHDTSRLNDHLHQDSSHSSSFAAYETASVRYALAFILIASVISQSIAVLSLWPPCVADADIIFLPCGFFFFLSSSSSFFFCRLI